ncbi:carbohydrate kinase [Zeaxanthinibacter sp. PT1]|uniref:carbohydrate kinase family protein n=1 Tax=Zeaxanthinibacter TaxID=561554 RepID=UPI00234ACDC9|nr:carbohydrate kinase [Zeaxanthinibacter sp. PT1]MDC6350874.1 carbohydrate kinase [Zeaxanthinibacter sp. PT1]
MKKVFCIGEALIDFVAEHQGSDLAKASDFTKKAGGAPANVACAIAKLGGRSSFIGSVGDDPFGTFLLDILESHEVDLSFIEKSETFTTMAFVSIAEDGERDFVFSRGADRELPYNPGVKSLFKGNMVHLGAATALLGGTLEKSYGHYFFDALTQNAFISFDPNYRSDLWKKRDKEFIRKCLPYIEKSHLCKFSLEEARLISGKEDLDDACKVLHKLGTRIITITLGKEGTYVSSPGGIFTVPSIAVNPVDTTGAGDAFIGCLLWQISMMDSHQSLFENAQLLQDMIATANKAGAITTTNFGAIESLPTQRQLQS